MADSPAGKTRLRHLTSGGGQVTGDVTPHGGGTLHQAEYRWQPDGGFAVIASSFPDREAEREWSARTAVLARPPVPDAASGIPDRSVACVYFPDGMAALLWRTYERDALALSPGGAGHPLVARALIGPVRVLTAGLAMALAQAGVASVLEPPPGQVAPGTRLEHVDSASFAGVSRAAARNLDQRAGEEPGLAALIAAVARHPGTPVSVLLPASELSRSPVSSPALPLLWGTWRAMSPRPGSWSFSTYEPPPGRAPGPPGAAGLPAIVFRSEAEERRGHQPPGDRLEITVRPRRDGGGDDDIGQVLAAAYRDLDRSELDRSELSRCL